eukprot:scpid105462/ scgid7211/ 
MSFREISWSTPKYMDVWCKIQVCGSCNLWVSFQKPAEHREFERGAVCGCNLWISLKIMKSTANPCGAQSVDFVVNHEEHSEYVWGKRTDRAQRIRVGRYL